MFRKALAPDAEGTNRRKDDTEVDRSRRIRSQARFLPVGVAAINVSAIACGVLAICALSSRDSERRAGGHEDGELPVVERETLPSFVILSHPKLWFHFQIESEPQECHPIHL